jgi:HEAT repeat protein
VTEASLPPELQAPDAGARRKALLALASRPPSHDLLDTFLQVARTDTDMGLRMLARQLFQESRANLGGAEVEAQLVDDKSGEYKVDGLAQMLERDGETSTKLEAIRTAVEDQRHGALPVFRKRLGEETDPWIIASLLKAVGTLGDSQDIHLVQPFLKNDDLRIQANAIEALELIGDELSFSLVAPMLKSRDARIRANSIKCLVRFDPDEAIATLERLAFSEEVGERESAVYCLGIVAHPRVPEIAAEMAPQEKEPTLLRRQIRLLSEEGDRSAVGPLAYLAEVLEGESQEQAALALGRVRGRVSMTDDEVDAAKALVEVEYGSSNKELVADDDVMVSRFGMSMPEGTLPQAAAAAAEQEVVSYLTKRVIEKRKKPEEVDTKAAVLQFFKENPAFVGLAGVTGMFLLASVGVFLMPGEAAKPPPRPTKRAPITRKVVRKTNTDKPKEPTANERVTLEARVTNIDRNRKTALLKHDGKILSVKLDSDPGPAIERNTEVEVRGHFTGKVRFGAREFVAVDIRKR